VAYHHIEFPYENFDRFVSRTHRWVPTGLPLLGAGLYLSLCLAIWTLFNAWSLISGGAVRRDGNRLRHA
jgi:hypothetical protein